MDWLEEKLTQAASVNKRVIDHVAAKADDLIAREQEVLDRSERAFEPHHAALDQRMKELDRVEDAIQIVENENPLPRTGDTAQAKVDSVKVQVDRQADHQAAVEKLLQDAVGQAVSSPLKTGSDAPHEPAK